MSSAWSDCSHVLSEGANRVWRPESELEAASRRRGRWRDPCAAPTDRSSSTSRVGALFQLGIRIGLDEDPQRLHTGGDGEHACVVGAGVVHLAATHGAQQLRGSSPARPSGTRTPTALAYSVMSPWMPSRALRPGQAEAEAGDHLVDHEHRAVASAQLADTLEVTGRRRDQPGVAHHRLHEHARDRPRSLNTRSTTGEVVPLADDHLVGCGRDRLARPDRRAAERFRHRVQRRPGAGRAIRGSGRRTGALAGGRWQPARSRTASRSISDPGQVRSGCSRSTARRRRDARRTPPRTVLSGEH